MTYKMSQKYRLGNGVLQSCMHNASQSLWHLHIANDQAKVVHPKKRAALPTTYHLLIETVDPSLSRGMRQLNGVYTQEFNRQTPANRPRLPRAVQGDPRRERCPPPRTRTLCRPQPRESEDGPLGAGLAMVELPSDGRIGGAAEVPDDRLDPGAVRTVKVQGAEGVSEVRLRRARA